MSDTTQPTDDVARRVLENLERHVNNGDPLSAEARRYLARMQEQSEREHTRGLVATGANILQSEFMPESRVEPGQRLAYDPVNNHWVGVDETQGRDWTTGVVVGTSNDGMVRVQFTTENPQMARDPNNLLATTQEMLRNMRQRNSQLLQGTQQQRGNLDTIATKQSKKKRKTQATTVNTGGTRQVLRRKRKT